MVRNSFSIQHLLTSAVFLLIALSCDSTNPSPVTNYFPLEEGFSWKYKVMTDCECDCPCSGFADLMPGQQHFNIMTVKGDTVLDGKSYKQIRNRDGWALKFVRQAGEAYYTRSYYGEEFKFLDTSVPVGGSWIQPGEFDSEIVNTIRSVTKTFKINNKLYKNVIEVEETVYGNSDAPEECAEITSFSYYAQGLGEVYAYRPYDRCSYYSGDIHSYLVSAGR